MHSLEERINYLEDQNKFLRGQLDKSRLNSNSVEEFKMVIEQQRLEIDWLTSTITELLTESKKLFDAVDKIINYQRY